MQITLMSKSKRNITKRPKKEKNISIISDFLDTTKFNSDYKLKLSNDKKLDSNFSTSDILDITFKSNLNIKTSDMTLEPLSLNNTYDNNINSSFECSNSIKSDIFCPSLKKNKYISQTKRGKNLSKCKSSKSGNLSFYESPVKLNDTQNNGLKSDSSNMVEFCKENEFLNRSKELIKIHSEASQLFDKTSTPLSNKRRFVDNVKFFNKSFQPKMLKLDEENKNHEKDTVINACSPILKSSNIINILSKYPNSPLIGLQRNNNIIKSIEKNKGIKYSNESIQAKNRKTLNIPKSPCINLEHTKSSKFKNIDPKNKMSSLNITVNKPEIKYNLRKRKTTVNNQNGIPTSNFINKFTKDHLKKLGNMNLLLNDNQKLIDKMVNKNNIVKENKSNIKIITKSKNLNVINVTSNLDKDLSSNEFHITKYQINFSPKIYLTRIDNLYNIEKNNPIARNYKIKDSGKLKKIIGLKSSPHNQIKDDGIIINRSNNLQINNRKRKCTSKQSINKRSKISEKLNVEKINIINDKIENPIMELKSLSGKNIKYNQIVEESITSNKRILRSFKKNKTDDQDNKLPIIARDLESSKSKFNANLIKMTNGSYKNTENKIISKKRTKHTKYGALINLLEPCPTQENFSSNIHPVEKNIKNVAKIIGGKNTYKRHKSVQKFLNEQAKMVSEPICTPTKQVLFSGLEDKLLFSFLRQSNVTLESSTGDSVYGVNLLSANSSSAFNPSDTFRTLNFASPKTEILTDQHNFKMHKTLKTRKMSNNRSKKKQMKKTKLCIPLENKLAQITSSYTSYDQTLREETFFNE